MIKKQDMSNAAYSEEYLQCRKKVEDDLFIQERFDSSEEIVISDSLVWARKHYANQSYCGSENVILKDGKQIYSFKNLEDQAEFCKLIHHSNGNSYLLFRRDLYGYSVLNLNTLEDFHYFPACNIKPKDETFIWCDPIYNPKNDLLIVFGCYWACPYDLILVDFKDPFAPAENQVCIYFKKEIGDIIDNGYYWDGTTLVISSKHSKTKKTHRITEAQCRKWLAEGNYAGGIR